jgi:hypothetical protein
MRSASFGSGGTTGRLAGDFAWGDPGGAKDWGRGGGGAEGLGREGAPGAIGGRLPPMGWLAWGLGMGMPGAAPPRRVGAAGSGPRAGLTIWPAREPMGVPGGTVGRGALGEAPGAIMTFGGTTGGATVGAAGGATGAAGVAAAGVGAAGAGAGGAGAWGAGRGGIGGATGVAGAAGVGGLTIEPGTIEPGAGDWGARAVGAAGVGAAGAGAFTAGRSGKEPGATAGRGGMVGAGGRPEEAGLAAGEPVAPMGGRSGSEGEVRPRLSGGVNGARSG